MTLKFGVRVRRQAQRPGRRASTSSCPIPDYQQCGDGLPSNFCCQSGTSCLALAQNTAALCCPEGGDCSQIRPITCSIDLQNATAYPASPVHTANLTGELPSCGTGLCCPFGYSCSGNSICVLDQVDTSSVAGILTAATSSSVTTTSTTSSVVAHTTPLMTETASSPLVIPTSAPSPAEPDGSSPKTSNRSQTVGIAAGSTAAGVISILGLLFFAWIKRQRIRETLQRKFPEAAARRFSKTPPPLPPKPPFEPQLRRQQIMGFEPPPLVQTSPVELPATPVSFSFWQRRWSLRQPNKAHLPYPRDSLSPDAQAGWLPSGVR